MPLPFRARSRSSAKRIRPPVNRLPSPAFRSTHAGGVGLMLGTLSVPTRSAQHWRERGQTLPRDGGGPQRSAERRAARRASMASGVDGAGDCATRFAGRAGMFTACVAVPASLPMSARSSLPSQSRPIGLRPISRPPGMWRRPIPCQWSIMTLRQVSAASMRCAGPDPLLGERHQDRLLDLQRQGRGDRDQASFPRGVPAAALPGAAR